MLAFQKPRILTEAEANTIRGKCLVGHATPAEQMQLISHFDLVEQRLRRALESLRDCLPCKIYIYGGGFSEFAPDSTNDYDLVDFSELLDGER